MAEAAAALYALDLAVRMGYTHVMLEGDAMMVTTTIARRELDLTPMFQLFENIMSLSLNVFMLVGKATLLL
ncbi:unnamed protein product [Amaranthus hypochondriacus]